MDFLIGLSAVIVLGFLAYGIYKLYLYIIRRMSAKVVDASEIEDKIRRVQLVDVREQAEFDAKHILGARNIPMSQFSMRHKELRKDQPIYLYDDSMSFASRAANILRKSGYKDVYILKGGFSKWFGKVKSNIK
ncbi:rhodanese-like domain-containing protein [Fundicoccus culcitae]|uniref:Rhodanese-like domain-containing protein n=1 Tax=Fundicoccus culcitae TaxID=2969821 RepID=A0ABY5P805_9LACT|nr:rhodanese-like domain-containing protein [Fundicoccus culcitae]UUX34578.1 rhodanese-like domain-containing protein [Fundicoccus culcitae]